jgi:Kef-type K+ transport system membrane component KefB
MEYPRAKGAPSELLQAQPNRLGALFPKSQVSVLTIYSPSTGRLAGLQQPIQPLDKVALMMQIRHTCNSVTRSRAAMLLESIPCRKSFTWPIQTNEKTHLLQVHGANAYPLNSPIISRSRVNKNLILYLSVLIFFGLGMYTALHQGRTLQPPSSPSTDHPEWPARHIDVAVEPSASLLANLNQHFQDPLTRLFIQVILIVLVARGCGALATRAGQPAVIGEMIAGILLGPSLLGWVWPSAFEFTFPPASLGTLRMLSQLGVCLFMFVVGMEFDVHHLKHRARTAILVSQVSILFPCLLGVLASLFLFSTYAAPHTSFVAFALFIGISMSITAFPVLARILEERGLTRTALGSTALACAAFDDVTAWSALAFVVAVVKAGGLAASVLNLALVFAFVAVMLFWIKPRLPRWIGRTALRDGVPGKGVMAGSLVFLFASALATDLIGIHALFGAFLAGVVMPSRGEFRQFLKLRLEHFSSVFLLPLFFAFTGLRTQVDLLSEPSGWLICLGLILLATLAKLGGAMLAARLTGVNWFDSFALGALMNTRGLIELVALNIGYDLGILSSRIFTMLVLMALVTTGLTGPLLNFSEFLRNRRALVPAT